MDVHDRWERLISLWADGNHIIPPEMLQQPHHLDALLNQDASPRVHSIELLVAVIGVHKHRVAKNVVLGTILLLPLNNVKLSKLLFGELEDLFHLNLFFLDELLQLLHFNGLDPVQRRLADGARGPSDGRDIFVSLHLQHLHHLLQVDVSGLHGCRKGSNQVVFDLLHVGLLLYVVNLWVIWVNRDKR